MVGLTPMDSTCISSMSRTVLAVDGTALIRRAPWASKELTMQKRMLSGQKASGERPVPETDVGPLAHRHQRDCDTHCGSGWFAVSSYEISQRWAEGGVWRQSVQQCLMWLELR